MLSRGFYDAVSLWPVVFWPIAFSSCLYAYIRLCRLSRTRFGYSPLDGDSWADKAVVYLIIPGSLLFQVLAHGFRRGACSW